MITGEVPTMSLSDILSGFLHPLLGLDHFLAMLSVGIVSAQIGNRAIWLVPSVFVGSMVFGATLGIYKVYLPEMELAIGFSVLFLGSYIAFYKQLPQWPVYLIVGLFGSYHGHAHGIEMPELANPWSYGLGFTSGTASIHVLGVLIGLPVQNHPKYSINLRFVGAYMGGIGIQMINGLLF
jgi:urease accessory protein